MKARGSAFVMYIYIVLIKNLKLHTAKVKGKYKVLFMWKITSALIYYWLPEYICKNCAEECNWCASVCIQLSSDKLGIIRFIFRELWKRCSKGALRRPEKKINIRHPSLQSFQLVQGIEMMRQFFSPQPFSYKDIAPHNVLQMSYSMLFLWQSVKDLYWCEFYCYD